MTVEESKKVETESTTSEVPPPAPEPSISEAPLDVTEEKSVVPPPEEEKPDESKSLAVVETEAPECIEEKSTEGSINRDAVLARVETEKKMSLIHAWEESEKCKAENKAHKKISAVASWENSKKATIEAELKMIEERLEKKKAEYLEKMKNKAALIHKEAEEKKAMIEAKKKEDILKAEETAKKYRSTKTTPKKLLGWF